MSEPSPPATLDPTVATILASVADLDAVPVEQHVALFENAHAALRRTLDGAAAEAGEAGEGGGS